ncbi:MAG: PqqD family peptide modification chaperone [Rhodobacteraceae bacterium]|nr:PqqD family peptide modification chaperone [Paracoccaceae bacterium]
MTETHSEPQRLLHFDGLTAPVVLERADQLLPVVSGALPKWPFTQADNPGMPSPCFSIGGDGSGEFLCRAGDSGGAGKPWDAVNAVCEMVVELAWEQIRCNPGWLCLHCAAVEFNGRLILFPNRRRAGKSTLTAVLAARGYRVYTDDFLPVHVDEDGRIFGVANGVAPRIRLPVPDGFSAEFHAWAAQNKGPGNRRYKYLDIEDLADRGTMLPVGAVVVLDRDTDMTEATLTPALRGQVLDDLITQNFARTLHSGRILLASEGVTDTAELFRLQYGSAELAADRLAERFQTWTAPVRTIKHPRRLQTCDADLKRLEAGSPAFLPAARYLRAPGVTEVECEGTLYVSDGFGLGIHRLNPGARAIWQLVSEPLTVNDVAGILTAAFPDIPGEQIATDSLATMTDFVANRLVRPEPDLPEPVA